MICFIIFNLIIWKKNNFKNILYIFVGRHVMLKWIDNE